MKNFFSTLSSTQRNSLRRWWNFTLLSCTALLLCSIGIVVPHVYDAYHMRAEYTQCKVCMLQDQHILTTEQEHTKQLNQLTEQANRLERKKNKHQNTSDIISILVQTVPADMRIDQITHSKNKTDITLTSNSNAQAILAWLERAQQNSQLKQLHLNSIEPNEQKTKAHVSISRPKKEAVKVDTK